MSLLYAGWDKHFGFQLYQSDPSGNFTGWKATCIGNNHQAAIALLKQEYKSVENTTLDDAKKLAMKVLSKTLDVKLSAEKVEMAQIKLVDGRTVMKQLTHGEITRLIEDHEAAEAAETTAAPSGTS